MAFTKQKTLRCEVIESRMRQLTSSVQVMRIAKHVATKGETEAAGDGVIDVARLNIHEPVEKLDSSSQTIGPFAPYRFVEHRIMVLQSFRQSDRMKNCDSFPRAQSYVIHPTAIGTADLLL